MKNLLIGLIKGAIIGTALGYGAYQIDWYGGWNWLIAGLVGASVGLFVGKPLWRQFMDKGSTSVTSIIKAVFGFGIGCGLYALAAKVWGGMDLTLQGETRNVLNWQPILGGAIGAVYGAFVEWDDSIGSVDEKRQKLTPPKD